MKNILILVALVILLSSCAITQKYYILPDSDGVASADTVVYAQEPYGAYRPIIIDRWNYPSYRIGYNPVYIPDSFYTLRPQRPRVFPILERRMNRIRRVREQVRRTDIKRHRGMQEKKSPIRPKSLDSKSEELKKLQEQGR